MHKPLVLLASLLLLPACPASRTVRLVGMTDYHSHARPFYSEGEPEQGGVARAVEAFRAAKTGPATLGISGGDWVNRGVPVWSDEYGCVEWPWFRGLVDVMALGNHDLDYGAETFERCRASLGAPVLCANLVEADGSAHFQVEGRPYLVREVGGVRIGLFAVAGPDMQRLVKPEHLPAGTRWTDATQAARAVVEALRGREHVDAVVLIGHQLREDDEALARAVPGIDLILGSHSHVKQELTRVPGTRTAYVSPYQYLTYLSDVRLSFSGHTLVGVEGGLVKLDGRRRADAAVAARVDELERALRAKRPERFARVGELTRPLGDVGLTEGPAPVGTWATEVWRRAAGARAFFATAAGFRAGLPAGEVTEESLEGAFPYRNVLVTGELSGAELAGWVALSESKRGTDSYSQSSGVRYTVREGRVEGLEILADAREDAWAPQPVWEPVRTEGRYLVGTTDFQAFVAGGYRELFARAADVRRTRLDTRQLLREALHAGMER